MAFASGGLFGRGIGNSTMKYSYLPEAHNDYILAIIGEEVGFLGTLLFFLVFAIADLLGVSNCRAGRRSSRGAHGFGLCGYPRGAVF